MLTLICLGKVKSSDVKKTTKIQFKQVKRLIKKLTKAMAAIIISISRSYLRDVLVCHIFFFGCFVFIYFIKKKKKQITTYR